MRPVWCLATTSTPIHLGWSYSSVFVVRPPDSHASRLCIVFTVRTILSRTDFPCAGMQKIWESHIEGGFSK